MSWIKENKFVAGLAGVTTVITVAILYVGLSQGGAYDEKLEQYQDLKGQYATLEKSKPYPSSENLSDREEGIEEYENTISAVRQLVLGYRPEKLEKMTPEQFKDIRVKMEDDLKVLFAKKPETKLPEGCAFGFETYAEGTSVKAGATAKLHYELGAIQWMLGKLAGVKPDAIANIRRIELPEESGKVIVAEPQPRNRKGRARGPAGGKNSQKAAGRAYELMPMEISFTASEASVREFLLALVNSKEYFYAVRGVRILNESQAAPNQRDASFPVENVVEGNDLFGGLDGLDGKDNLGDGLFGEGESEDGDDAVAAEEPAKAAIPAGELILKQVLGKEKLNVFICLDIVLIEKKADGPQPKQQSGQPKLDR